MGAQCYVKCPEHCKACLQDASAKCTKCIDGYFLGTEKDCKGKCPSNCIACDSLSHCTKCKEGFYSHGTNNDCRYAYCPVNCVCEDGTCISCKDGFYNTSVLCESTCPQNCASCFSDEICAECRDGYYSGFKFDIQDNGKSETCGHNCRRSCKRCTSYGECTQCKDGSYGLTCEKKCSVGCDTINCSLATGECDCRESFIGTVCTKCIAGKYGLLCNMSCPSTCMQDANVSSCDSRHGNCLLGCMDGLFGPKCNIPCNSQCIDRLCMQDDGKCTRGCYTPFDRQLCSLIADKQESEDSKQTAIIVMGVIIALLVVVVIGLIVSKFVVWKSQSTQRNGKGTDVSFENTTPSSNIEHRRNDEHMPTELHAVYYNVTEENSDSSSADSSNAVEYEKIKSIQVPEHEYEHISSAV